VINLKLVFRYLNGVAMATIFEDLIELDPATPLSFGDNRQMAR